jgi:hypothetical protein
VELLTSVAHRFWKITPWLDHAAVCVRRCQVQVSAPARAPGYSTNSRVITPGIYRGKYIVYYKGLSFYFLFKLQLGQSTGFPNLAA